MASQWARDSGEAAGEVSSMYSTPNSSSLSMSVVHGAVFTVQHKLQLLEREEIHQTGWGLDVHLGNLDLSLEREESIGKLFSLCRISYRSRVQKHNLISPRRVDSIIYSSVYDSVMTPHACIKTHLPIARVAQKVGRSGVKTLVALDGWRSGNTICLVGGRRQVGRVRVVDRDHVFVAVGNGGIGRWAHDG